MYAIFADGGKQYRVKPGQVLKLEKHLGEKGQSINLSPILMVKDDNKTHIGEPFLTGQISATILEQGKNKKITIFKKKRRKGYRVKNGHRQPFTSVRIDSITI